MESEKPKGPKGTKKEVVIAATPAEVERALSALTDVEVAKLQKIAAARALTLARLAPSHAADDLFQEAITRALDGRRVWPKNKVTFFEFLCGSMQSIAFDWRKKVRARPEGRLVRPREEPDEDTPEWIEGLPSDQATIEERLINKDAIEVLLRSFEGDEDVKVIIEACCEGMEKSEIAELGMGDARFKAADRRLRRRLTEFAERSRDHGE
ncbi:MAG: hypothetical protein JST04_08910 [Bdellovibrionales bacterium]|nr:hypothetical protein [Bdellovibrionales bacterium]